MENENQTTEDVSTNEVEVSTPEPTELDKLLMSGEGVSEEDSDFSFGDVLEERTNDESDKPTEESIETASSEEVAGEEQETEVSLDSQTSDEEETSKEWVPSYKYSSLDQEGEIDEIFKAVIKDKESETKVRELYEKSAAMDHFKQKHESVNTEYEEFKTAYESKMGDVNDLVQVVNNFSTGVNSKSIDDQYFAFKEAGIDDQKILDIARHILKVEKLEPSQRETYNTQREKKALLQEQEARIRQLEENVKSNENNSAKREFGAFLNSKSEFVKEFESREGFNDGDFSDMFLVHGEVLERRNPNISWDQAFNSFIKTHNLTGTINNKPKVAKKTPSSMPNLQTSGHSPVQRKYKNIDEMIEGEESRIS